MLFNLIAWNSRLASELRHVVSHDGGHADCAGALHDELVAVSQVQHGAGHPVLVHRYGSDDITLLLWKNNEK